MKIFLICPVRNATEEQIAFIRDYKMNQKKVGNEIYYPNDDNPYEASDTIGFDICIENVWHIAESDEVHIYYDPASSGTLFDLGAAFALQKKLVIVNDDAVCSTECKSFANMIKAWQNMPR